MKTIPGFPDYAVTRTGKVFSRKGKGRWLKPCVKPNGYTRVRLCRGGKPVEKYIHRLVLETYVGPCPEGMEGCHQNDIRTHNDISNLRWQPHKENIAHKYRRRP